MSQVGPDTPVAMLTAGQLAEYLRDTLRQEQPANVEPAEEQFVGLDEMASILGLKRYRVRELVQEGMPHSNKLGPRTLRFLPSEVRAWMRARGE